MELERVVFFLDFANIDRAASNEGVRLDYKSLLAFMSEGRFLVDAHAYVPIDPRNEHGRDGLINRLWEAGYLVHSKVGSFAGQTYKCDFDVEITMDVLTTVYQIRPDIIVLATGDSDFIPVVQEVRRQGVRLELASFKKSASAVLRLRASGFIDLDDAAAEDEFSPLDEAPDRMDNEEEELELEEAIADVPDEPTDEEVPPSIPRPRT